MLYEGLEKHTRRIHRQADDLLPTVSQLPPFKFRRGISRILDYGSKIRNFPRISARNIGQDCSIVRLPDPRQRYGFAAALALLLSKPPEQHAVPDVRWASQRFEFFFEEFYLALEVQEEEIHSVKADSLHNVIRLLPDRSRGNTRPIHGV